METIAIFSQHISSITMPLSAAVLSYREILFSPLRGDVACNQWMPHFLVCNIHAHVKCEGGIIFFIPCQKDLCGVNLSSMTASGSKDLTATSVLHLYNPALFKWWLSAKSWYVLLNPHVFRSTWLDLGTVWKIVTKKDKLNTIFQPYWN